MILRINGTTVNTKYITIISPVYLYRSDDEKENYCFSIEILSTTLILVHSLDRGKNKLQKFRDVLEQCWFENFKGQTIEVFDFETFELD